MATPKLAHFLVTCGDCRRWVAVNRIGYRYPGILELVLTKEPCTCGGKKAAALMEGHSERAAVILEG